MQHIGQSVQPVFDILTSFSVVRLTVLLQRSVGSGERSTGPCLSGSTALRGRWCFHWNPVATGSVDHRSKL